MYRVARTVVAPLDFLKIRFQVDDTLGKRNIVSTLKDVVKNEGWVSVRFWKWSLIVRFRLFYLYTPRVYRYSFLSDLLRVACPMERECCRSSDGNALECAIFLHDAIGERNPQGPHASLLSLSLFFLMYLFLLLKCCATVALFRSL